MIVTINYILIVLAFVCFLLEAFKFSNPRINLVALGLAFWTLSLLVR